MSDKEQDKEQEETISTDVYCENSETAENMEQGKNRENAKTLQQKRKKYISMGMIIVACILFIVAFTRINNKEYKFCKQQYAECKEGYFDMKVTADSYHSTFFKTSYNSLADSYKGMVEDYQAKINAFRIQAAVCAGIGSVLLIVGVKERKAL